MFVKSYLENMANIAKAKSDLDRLQFLPQRVEGGVVYNFKGKKMFDLAIQDLEVIKADRVTEASRFTSALSRDYFEGLEKMLGMINDVPTSNEVQSLEDKLLEIVATGDKKAFRSIRKDLKEQWFALNDEDVEDALFDLSDAVSDQDVEFAKEILDGLEPSDTAEDTIPKDTTEEVEEIIEDIKSAIDDGDEKDFKELLADLKELDPKAYDEWKDAFQEDDDDDVVGEIIADLEAAEDDEEKKELLEELAEEVGADSELYKEWAAKIAPSRRRRR